MVAALDMDSLIPKSSLSRVRTKLPVVRAMRLFRLEFPFIAEDSLPKAQRSNVA